MYDLRESGTTVLFVSHSMGMIRKFCTEAVLLHKGHMVTSGSPDVVADRYGELISKAQERKDARSGKLDDMLDREEEEDLEGIASSKKTSASGSERVQNFRPGTARIERVELLDEEGNPVDVIPSGSTLTIRVHVEYAKAISDSALGITLRSKKAGLDVFSTDTTREKTPLGRREEGERATVDFTFGVPLQAGSYSIAATVSDPGRMDLYLDRVDAAAVFKVARSRSELPVQGLVHLPTKVKIHAPEQERPSRSA
jgi:hypothetical protein